MAQGIGAVDEESAAEDTWRARPNAVGSGMSLLRNTSPVPSDTTTVNPVLRRSLTSAGPAGGAPAPAVIRRKITATGADVRDLRSKQGLRKGARTKDSLYQLAKLLDEYQTVVAEVKNQQALIDNLAAIVAVCDEYILMHGRSREVDRLLLVDQIQSEAHRDLGQARAQQRYLSDLKLGTTMIKTGEAPKQEKKSRNPITQLRNLGKEKQSQTPMTQLLGHSAAGWSQMTSERRDETLHPDNPMAAPARLAKEHGLTEAEMAAIRTYTAADYMYMNPAVANDRAWLGKQKGNIQQVADIMPLKGMPRRTMDTETMIGEGATHAGVAMQGLLKLPPKKGKVYRGARMSDKEFQKAYGGKTVTYKAFSSSSTEEGAARNYATGAGTVIPTKDQTISVFAVFDCIDARDVKPFSETGSEKEWLLLPGATFVVTKVEDDPDFSSARGATSGKIVHLVQVPKAPTDVVPPPGRKPA